MSETNEFEPILKFLKAQKEAEQEGKQGYPCPLCGGKAYWNRATRINHLHCACESCGIMILW